MANTFHRTQSASGLTAVLGLTLNGTNRPLPSPGLTAVLGLTLHGLVGRLSSWNEARRTRTILSKLSAHELDDIGLNRGDIDEIARRTY